MPLVFDAFDLELTRGEARELIERLHIIEVATRQREREELERRSQARSRSHG